MKQLELAPTQTATLKYFLQIYESAIIIELYNTLYKIIRLCHGQSVAQ